MALSKRAKLIDEAVEPMIFSKIMASGRHRQRNMAMFMLSVRQGLRAKEISCLTWSMVTNSTGDIAADLELENKAAKGARGGRSIPMHAATATALMDLLNQQRLSGQNPDPHSPVIRTERQCPGGPQPLSPRSIVDWFKDLYDSVGLQGCTSHSGRRTFVTHMARTITSQGGSLRDVQEMAGHASLNTTQIYIDGNKEAKRRAVAAFRTKDF